MSWAVQALVSIGLAERPGQFVPLSALAAMQGLPSDALLPELEQMEADGRVQLCRDAQGLPVSATARRSNSDGG